MIRQGQPSNRASAKEPSNSEPNDKTISTVNKNHQLPSPNSTQNQLPLESELSVPPLQQNKPDQGKLPVERRKRRSAKDPTKPAPRRRTSAATKVTPPTIPVVPSLAAPTNSVTKSNSASLVPGAESMQAATESFNKNSGRTRTEDHPEVVYVSGAVTFVPPSTEATPPPGIHAPGPAPAVLTETIPAMLSTTKDAAPPAASVSRGTIWPQNKKWALASAARDALTSNSMNAGKSIPAEDIVRLLDQEPSYETLCEMLERRGFIIDRSHFARLLLTAVPGLNSDDPDAHPSTVDVPKPQPDLSDGSPTLVNSDNDLGLLIKNHNDLGHNDVDSNGVSHAQNEVTGRQGQVTNGKGNGNVTSGTPKPDHEVSGKKRKRKPKSSVGNKAHSFGQFGMLVPPRPTFGSAVRSESNHVQWISQNAPVTEPGGGHLNHKPVSTPLTKKQLAVKKSFAELVDLTQDISDEEDKLRQMKTRLDMIHDLNDAPLNSSPYLSAPGASSDGPASNFVDLTVQKEKRKYKKILGGNADRSSLNSAAVTEDESLDLSQFKYDKSQHDLLQSNIIVQPINKRNDALRRSTYNPKTIARDILVSAGKHLTMAPLNYHLEILRRKFTHVDNNSDLGTFRWDLVDPGGEFNAEPQDADMNDADDEDVNEGNDTQIERRRMQVVSTVDGEGVLVSGKISFEQE